MRSTSLRPGCFAALVVLGCAFGPFGPPAVAASDSPEADGLARSRPSCPVPDDATLEADGAVIGEIMIQVGDIFDPELPEENGRLYLLVNRLHRTTRPTVVESLLLFRSGDPYSRRLLEESERLLRGERYFYDAAIRPVSYCGNRVDLEVRVRDVWTLYVSASVSRSGGENGTRFEIEDVNVLGTGKDIALERTSNVDRTRLLARYRDRNLMGSRVHLEAAYAEADDGDLQFFELRRPFFALDTRWAAGLKARLDDRVDDHYYRGEVTGSFRHQQDFVEMSRGWSRGLRRGHALRWQLGATYLADRFSLASGPPPPMRRGAVPRPGEEPPLVYRAPAGSLVPRALPPGGLPPDRTLAYPWVGFDWLEDDFAEIHDFDQLARTEDLYLGRRVGGRLGWSSELFGGDGERAVFQLSARDGGELAGGLLLWRSAASGRYGGDGAENLLLGGAARYYHRTFGRHLFVAEVGADWVEELDPERQLLLGGDNGLRGYPLRYQEGDRRFLVTLEQRFYTSWHVLNLVHVGAAVFADVGRAWFSGAPDVPGSGLLRDVGLGLRLASSRSGRGTLVHLDVAFPLDGDPSIDRVQWLITTKETF